MLKHLIQRIRGTAGRHPEAPVSGEHASDKHSVYNNVDENAQANRNVPISDDVKVEALSAMQPPTLTDQVASDVDGTPIHIPVFSPSNTAAKAPSGEMGKAASKTQSKSAVADDMSGLPFMIRPANAAEISSLGDVFIRAIEGTAKRDYDTAQIAAWTSKASTAEFSTALADGVTILAEHHDQPIAFAQLCPNDCIRMLYVDPEWASLGIATLMCQYLEDEARILGSKRLTTHASHTAKRFFESMGFKTEQEETVEVNGVALTRTRMEKRLTV
jgi:putative acetyltransferase